jgi:NAD(P)-dependent dehydrogenase (short-subunit alcohol dehydrogenase family)
MLSGKIAVVTGSTSGIGPGISITRAVLPIDGGRTTH